MAEHTTEAVQRFLDELAGVPGDAPAEPIVRDLLARAVNRLHQLCAHMLYRGYPRLTRGPLNLCPEELLSSVTERMLKAMREVRPGTVRQFFALAHQHMRWELNDLARRLDQQAAMVELRDSCIAPTAAPSAGAGSASSSDHGPEGHPGRGLERVLTVVEALPADEREVFNLVRVQGLSNQDAANVVGVSTRTVRRRLNRSLVLLRQNLGDLAGRPPPPDGSPSPSAPAPQ